MEIQKAARYDVELLTIGHDQKQLEKLLGHVKGLAASPQDIVESCPCTIATNISGMVSAKLKRYLEPVGAVVTIRKHGPTPPAETAQTADAVRSEPRAANAAALERGHPHEQRAVSPTAVTAAVKSAAVRVEPQNGTPPHAGASLVRRVVGEYPAAQAVAPTAITLKRTVGELTRALSDKDWMVREHAIIELGQIPSDGIMRHLLGVLKDDVWRVRCTALEVLSKTGSDMVLKEIAKCVADDVWHVRYQAVEALGRMGSDRVLKPLAAALHDPNWQVRQRAVQLLGNIQSRQALNTLSACLKDDVAAVRESAAEALGKLKLEKSVKALIDALRDPNWRVRSMAVTALKEIGSEQAISGLIDALADPAWMVHWKAAYALGKIGTTAIFPVLCRLEKEDQPSLGEAARKILGTLDIVVEPNKRAAPRVEYRADNPYLNMRYIPAGEFIMGDDHGHDDAKPACRIFLPEFFIDAYEVTNAQYHRFDPSHGYPEGMDVYPVVNVTWEEAQAYAAWVGKRLPTEAEWEKAARGETGRRYPWGDDFDPSKCNTEESGNRRLTKANHYPPGKSPFGAADMFGNVLEWTAERYQPYRWSQYDSLDFRENFVVLRGSSWIHQGSLLTCATRIYAPPDNKSNFIGFRCVKEIE